MCITQVRSRSAAQILISPLSLHPHTIHTSAVTLFIIFSRDSSLSTPVYSLPVAPVKGQCDGIWVRSTSRFPSAARLSICVLSPSARHAYNRTVFGSQTAASATSLPHLPTPPSIPAPNSWSLSRGTAGVCCLLSVQSFFYRDAGCVQASMCRTAWNFAPRATFSRLLLHAKNVADLWY